MPVLSRSVCPDSMATTVPSGPLGATYPHEATLEAESWQGFDLVAHVIEALS